MEDLNNTNTQLILGIKEGNNFDRVRKPTIIIATLNGHSLESRKVQADCKPQYASNLTWEMDKNTIRKMRCNQTPIKVECFTVNDNGSREKLGYILLSIRSAQVIPPNKDFDGKANWHSILGVRNDFNNSKPQLLLYLIVKENDSRLTNTVLENEQLLQYNSTSSNVTPIWIQEEQLIQLGPFSTCQDLFMITITAEAASNLRHLLEESEICSTDEVFFVYKIFNTTTVLRPFRVLCNPIFVKEKTVIKIRTSLFVLSNFLNAKSHFFIEFKNKNVTLALSEVNLKSLISTNNLREFKQINKNTGPSMSYISILKPVFVKDNIEKCIKVEDKPSLTIRVKLQHFEELKTTFQDKSISQLQLDEKYTPNYSEERTRILKNLEWNPQVICGNSQSHNSDAVVKGSQMCKNSFSKYNSEPQIRNNNSECIDIYKNYCLNIHLNNVTFFDSRPDCKSIEFRFYDSQDKVITTICNNTTIVSQQTIELEGVNCKIYFISSPSLIKQLLKIFTLKIIVCDSTFSERKCIAQVNYDTDLLFCNEMPEYQYEASLMDCHSQREIGSSSITTVLEDYAIPVLNKIKKKNFGSSKNTLAYKIVDELETWRERQEEIFKDELQKKEETQLIFLNQEWQRRRKHLESKLDNSIQKCKILANNLSKTSEDLRLRKIQSLEKETKLIKENEELQWKYDRKIYQLQIALQKMQEEFTLNLNKVDEQNRNLILQIESLSQRNDELEQLRIEQAEKLESYKKATLTEDQTTSVLQRLKNFEEKLENSQRSKSFSKEQLNKAVKEIHRIKLENQKAIDSQINVNKSELNNIDLENILYADSTSLTYDQIALNEIQREIDVLNPEARGQHYDSSNIDDQIFKSQSDLPVSFNKKLIKINKCEGIDRKLNLLIKERDSLMKMQNYTNKDEIMVKLNEDIRSILMNN